MVNIFFCTINISIKCRKTLVSPTAGWQREEQAVWQGAGGHGILLHRHGAHPRVQVWTTHWIFKEGLLHRHGAHPIEFRFGLGIRYARMDSFTGSGLILECRFGLHMGYSRLTAHLRVAGLAFAQDIQGFGDYALDIPGRTPSPAFSA